MASNKIFNSQPAYISTVAASSNLFNCFTSQTPTWVGLNITQPYAIMKHIRVMNNLTTAAVNVTLYKGATIGTASGTQFAISSVSVAANSYVDWYGQARFDSGDFLTGLASLPAAAVINMEGEIGIA
jgi:hypothetical protein